MKPLPGQARSTLTPVLPQCIVQGLVVHVVELVPQCVADIAHAVHALLLAERAEQREEETQ